MCMYVHTHTAHPKSHNLLKFQMDNNLFLEQYKYIFTLRRDIDNLTTCIFAAGEKKTKYIENSRTFSIFVMW